MFPQARLHVLSTRLASVLLIWLWALPLQAQAAPGDVPDAEPPAGAPDGAPPADAPPDLPDSDAPPADDTPTGETPTSPDAPGNTPDAPSAGDAPAAPVLTPPRLVEFVPADYPEAAAAEELAATVELELTILPDGTTSEVKVVEPVGHGFDEAAVAAVEQFVFEPAKKDGQPIPARIRYRYVFELSPPPEPEPEAEEVEPTGRLEGRVLSREDDDAPLAGAEVQITSPEGGVIRLVSDAEGRFATEALPAGSYDVQVTLAEHAPLTLQETIYADEVAEVVYRLEEERDPHAFGATARVAPPPREVTRRTIEREHLTRIPGTRGDALRTVEILPGVARPPLGAGVLIIRGSSPQDSQPMFEGLPLDLLYHFGGLTSVLNSRLLDRIEFYPGNFSARYGRKRGGIVEVDARDPASDGLHGVADLNIIDTSLLVETPVGENLSVAASARRSNIDAVFAALPTSELVDFVALPVYYDGQVFATYRPTPRDRFRLFLYASDDKLRLFFNDPADADPALRGNFGFSTSFTRAHLSWKRQLSSHVDQDVSLAIGTTTADFAAGEAASLRIDTTPLYGRAEWRARISPNVRLITGFDVHGLLHGAVRYTGPQLRQGEGATQEPISNQEQISGAEEFSGIRPAMYLESDLRLTNALRVVLGSRLDWYSEIREWSFDPRMSAHLAVSDKLSLKAGVGSFSQPPEFQETSRIFGNPNLEATHSVHGSGGFDYTPLEGLFLSVEGFYKHMFDRVVSVPGGVDPVFVNDGIGRVYGMEVQGRVDPRGRFFGYLAYTLSRAERRDRNGPWRLFDFDQTHILTLSGTYRLGAGWELGATFRYVTGNPQTPVAGAIYNANSGIYSPVYGQLNSLRMSAFNRLDVRVQKQWEFDAWKLALYLDVQNSYNATNPEGLAYNFDYTEQTEVSGLPLIPVLGLRGEM